MSDVEAKRTDIESKACTLLARLADQLPDAKVEYQCRIALHEFTVRCSESRFSVRFTEQMLLRRSSEDIEATVTQIVGRIRTNTLTASAASSRLYAPDPAFGDFQGDANRIGAAAGALAPGPHPEKQHNDAQPPPRK
jgi:hypothetical protein